MTRSDYVFQQVKQGTEAERLRAIEHEFDPATCRRLRSTGVTRGWACLEVGPGAGSILLWMSDIVGPTGRVTGIDVSTRFLPTPLPPQVMVQESDIRTAPLPKSSFDLVHARYVLIHLPDSDVALSRMLDSLKPGGWLVLEEPDFSASRGVTGEAEQLSSVAKVNQAIRAMYDKLGMDYATGLALPARLQRHGLHAFTVENETPLSAGGSGMATIMRMSAEQLREKYRATGIVTDTDLDQYCRFAADPRTWAIYYATVAVVAQKPPRS
jgi:SAM-dependent methyltransferase